MLAINAAKSGKILLDIDIGHIGDELAQKTYAEFMASMDAPAHAPYCRSPSGGYHVMLKRPQGFKPEDLSGIVKPRMTSNVRPLADGEKDAEIISVRNRGYCVAPGSMFNGKHYLLTPEMPEPHECPQKLKELLKLPIVEISASKAGASEPADVSAVVAALNSHGEFDDEFKWKFHGLAPIKLALGDTEAGRSVAKQITWENVSNEEFEEQWSRFATVEDGREI